MRQLNVTVGIIDPSDKFRPEKKDETEFRNYSEDCDFIDRVRKTYTDMHTNQSVQYVRDRVKVWGNFDHLELGIMDALDKLNTLVDESDPDVDVPNSVHAFQTAERIREAHPDKPWFHLTGLIHDLGKVMAVWGEPQWSTVGDTFPVGCAFSDKIVFGKGSFSKNPDFHNAQYNTRLGMYEEGCGLDNVLMSWGHDEFMYRVLRNHPNCSLPEEAFYMIRFHSFYPWHTMDEYMYLCNEKDHQMLPWIREFNKFDLYSKSDSHPDPDELRSYYQALVDQYVPGKVRF